jgi:hypothetical protein
MKNRYYLGGARALLLAFTMTLSTSLIAGDMANLRCTGTVTQTTDGKAETKQHSVDLIIDLAAGTMKISGYWGCLADLGAAQKEICNVFPVKMTESEVTFFGHSKGTDYDGATNMTLNRYSGNLTATSIATAKTPAASWKLIMIDTAMACVAPQKLF